MERGVYFDAWFPRQHCYHPSLPPRRLRMVDDLEQYRATSLVWAAMGGGSISLPYLEQEAFGPVDPRYRVYGFVNDAEFVAECRRRGIKVFGIVFEVQGWEFAVELTEAEDAVLAMNELRGVGKRGWLGLREFSQNRYPKLWPPFEQYFPEGLRNSDGDLVTDLFEECCSRDIHGVPCHALWVECPDREHECRTMDRNNPVWREYLKAVIRIQIDAGVDGIQLDEAELPITSIQYGGCFCKDCMKQFAEYLRGLPADRLPAELAGNDLDGFHYGSWLVERGYDFKQGREETPLFWDYLRFQRGAIARYFGELADYIRDYGRSVGREVLVSGNFFNLFDHYYALEPSVDVLITEMRNTTYRQPAWYRYVAGFAGPKPVIVVENPYGGVVPELVETLQRGRGHDLFRMSLYEAAALGANMSVPYGAWMGSVVEDSFWAPHDLCVEIQRFLADNERLYSTSSAAELAVVFSIESSFRQEAHRRLADNRFNPVEEGGSAFWTVCSQLADVCQPFDVVMFPDGELRPDDLRPDELAGYRLLIAPDCGHLTAAQADLLGAFLDSGGRLGVLGALGENLEPARRAGLLAHPGTTVLDAAADPQAMLPDGPQITLEPAVDAALCPHRTRDGVALHLVRYGYDPELDRVPELAALRVSIRLDGAYTSCRALTPGGDLDCALSRDGDRHVLELQRVPLYTVIELTS